MFCKNCGNEVKDGVKFCSKCGATEFSENKVESQTAETNALTLLKGFEEYIKTEHEIPQPLPEEQDSVLKFKDILGILIKSIVGTVIIIPIARHFGVEVPFVGCAGVLCAVIGLYTYYTKEEDYDLQRYKISKEREKMLSGEGITKYQYEDEILKLINENYNRYIGTPNSFYSATIRDVDKNEFLNEIADIIRFAEEKMCHAELQEIIIQFYKNSHDCQITEAQNNMTDIKEKFAQLKAKCEDFQLTETTSDINHAIKIADEILNFEASEISMSYDDYYKALKSISVQIEKIEQSLKEAEEQRESAIASWENNISNYQQELTEISIIRMRYPDNELSSSFLKEYKRQIYEVEEMLHLPMESIRNRASDVDSDIRRHIDSLNSLIETEYTLRHKRIYGRSENKLAVKFKSIYK